MTDLARNELRDIPAEPSETKSPKMIVTSISIPPEVDAVLLKAGGGKRSRGVRELARMYLRMLRGEQ